jgi:hypothetical protein
MTRAGRSLIRKVLYALMVAIIVWQAVSMVTIARRPAVLKLSKKIDVTVTGNVNNPGTYSVPIGTTNYEILKVAGVRTNSDISGLDLNGEVAANQSISVGARDNPVKINAFVRLEFYLGAITIETRDGMERPVQEGIAIDAGNKLVTLNKAQAELSINSYSRIDVDDNTEISVEKVAVENGIRVVDVFQRSGMCWYKIAYSGKDEKIRVLTPYAEFSASGKGADFTVRLKSNGAGVDCRDGLVIVERRQTGERINVMAGQRAIAYSDERPFDIVRVSPDAALPAKFTHLNRKKAETPDVSGPVNILLCAVPEAYRLISIRFNEKKIHIVNIPAKTYVGDFASGFSTMGEAFLFGGSVFASSIAERLFNVRVPKYAIIEKEDISRVAASMGGVTILLDNAAASALRMSSGKHKVKDDELLAFMRPGISGSEDAARRQNEVIKVLFEGFRSKSIVMTMLMADQIMSNVESNMTSGEILGYYQKFSSGSSWELVNHTLPVKNILFDEKMFQQPLLEECRKILAEK